MDLQQRRQAIRHYIAAYPHSSRVLKDSDALLQAQPALLPKQENYTSEDGRTHLLLCFSGTIPVYFKQQVYNIPIIIYITHQYPNSPPHVFVTPTSNMVIKPNMNVDHFGRVYHSYLSSWNSRKDASNLVELCVILQQIFSKESPVFSKPATNQTSNVYGNVNTNLSPPLHTSTTTNLYSPPAYTPMPVPNLTTSITPSTAGSNSLYSPGNNFISTSQTNNNTSNYISGQYNTSEADIKLTSLKSALKDKLRQDLRSVNIEIKNEMDSAYEVNGQLLKNDTNITSTLRKFREDKLNFSDASSKLDVVIAETEELLRRAKSFSFPSVDDIVVAPKAIYKQLLDLTAEEHGIEDTLYYLGKQAQASNNLDVNAYLRLVRQLAVDQFLKRALIIKIRSLLNMDPV